MIINNEASKKELKNNILFLSQVAKEAKKRDPNTINSTSGMLFDEKGDLYVFDCVKKANQILKASDMYSYSDTAGSYEFQEAVKKWVFQDKYLELKDKLSAVATPGGSGAISLLFANYLNKGETILLPNHMWENYLNYAKEMEVEADTYQLFDEDGNFGINSIRVKVDFLKQTQDRIVIILNDPCENPTGFCMTDDDYNDLLTLVNDNPNTKFVIMMDMAYFDFYNQDSSLIRNRYYNFITNLADNGLCLFAYSGSKSLGLYGLRIGAIMLYAKDEEERKNFYNASSFSSRARWSSTSTYGINLVKTIIDDPELSLSFAKEIKEVCKMLEERAELFLASAREVDLKLLPYQKGFFVCVPTKDPVKLMNVLHQDKVHLVVTKTSVRIALCAISKKEAAVLPKIIKGRMLLEGME